MKVITGGIRGSKHWHEIPYLSTDDPHTKDVVSAIKKVFPHLIFVAYYDAILKPEVFNLAKEGAINLHLADSELYRGCFPTTYALINGDNKYGVTLHYIDKGVDTGPIIDKEIFDLDSSWTGKDLYEIATDRGYKLFKNNLGRILTNDVTTRPSVTTK